jgi:mono/diheme cytochrome c family protein
MDQQERFESQEENSFFPDGRADRPEVPGTVPVGGAKLDEHLYAGMVAGAPAETLPMKLDAPLLRRGQERFNIYCAPCHDGAATGDGIIVRHGMVPPPDFTDSRLRAMPIGKMFQVISHGERSMPSYAAQISVEDRWAIVAYVRTLQRARTASIDDIPADVAVARGWKK